MLISTVFKSSYTVYICSRAVNFDGDRRQINEVDPNKQYLHKLVTLVFNAGIAVKENIYNRKSEMDNYDVSLYIKT